MRAIGYRSVGDASQLEDVELPDPSPSGRDLLVEVQATSVNPVDTKVRRRQGPDEGEEVKVLGYDVAGVVREVGADVTAFSVGDEVWYAGSIVRPGANSELHLVDERIVSRRPSSLSVAEAAALPLTAITAWELLFDRLGVERGGGEGRTLLVVGAAGGVGSVLVQLAATQTRLRVVGTASRPETQEWVRSLGAHDVVDHSSSLVEELRAIGVDGVELVAALTHTDQHWDQLVEALAPQGRIGVIDDPVGGLDVMPLKGKSGSLAWELMFTRSTFRTDDMAEQGALLGEVARLVDEGVLRTTTSVTDPGVISAATLREAHEFIESGRAVGKVVLAGWPA
ncbi:zinc-binding alcohol dehydrogenase family protein [Nocardioides aurantiacus]|uniref:Zinc-type alcohol dehydrogenase-like protein n=1 Tax=Nocardioides aurantiacus TaxID=86796 RepID=A0A3N2CZX0_9ACTN|nr:zinc-binding alcohol dehydrogenase family protein [Nocardioides aurantiacus]ROR93033.1 zinc-binding alcohol dehydrogenase family protein [Nocardioides aurantiacus]